MLIFLAVEKVSVDDVVDVPKNQLVSSCTGAAGGSSGSGSGDLQHHSRYGGTCTSPKRNMSIDACLTHGSGNKLPRMTVLIRNIEHKSNEQEIRERDPRTQSGPN